MSYPYFIDTRLKITTILILSEIKLFSNLCQVLLNRRQLSIECRHKEFVSLIRKWKNGGVKQEEVSFVQLMRQRKSQFVRCSFHASRQSCYIISKELTLKYYTGTGVFTEEIKLIYLKDCVIINNNNSQVYA